MAELCVNIDHTATVRQARYRDPASGGLLAGAEPDPVALADEAMAGGAVGITVHLREDRRHIQDADVERLASGPHASVLNLEMAATDEMAAIAERVKPRTAMLVPEGRFEVTTEGGLDVAGQRDRLTAFVARLHAAGMRVSAFIDAEPAQVEAAAAAGFDICEVHTGPWAHAWRGASAWRDGEDAAARELAAVADAGARVVAAGMGFNAGHALSAANVGPVAVLPSLGELHIGHSIVSRAVWVGLRAATAEVVSAIRGAGATGGDR